MKEKRGGILLQCFLFAAIGKKRIAAGAGFMTCGVVWLLRRSRRSPTGSACLPGPQKKTPQNAGFL